MGCNTSKDDEGPDAPKKFLAVASPIAMAVVSQSSRERQKPRETKAQQEKAARQVQQTCDKTPSKNLENLSQQNNATNPTTNMHSPADRSIVDDPSQPAPTAADVPDVRPTVVMVSKKSPVVPEENETGVAKLVPTEKVVAEDYSSPWKAKKKPDQDTALQQVPSPKKKQRQFFFME